MDIDELEKPIDNDIQAVANTKRFYKSCMNESWIEKSSESSLLKLLNDSLNGWPLMNPSIVSGFNRADKLFQFMRLSTYPIFDLVMYSNPKQPAKYNLTIMQTSSFQSKSYYNDSQTMSVYKYYLTRIAEFMNVPASNANYKQDVEDAVSMEIDFANALLSEEELRDLNYDVYSLKELENLLPSVIKPTGN